MLFTVREIISSSNLYILTAERTNGEKNQNAIALQTELAIENIVT